MKPSPSISGGQPSVSSVLSEADRTPDGVKKYLKWHVSRASQVKCDGIGDSI